MAEPKGIKEVFDNLISGMGKGGGAMPDMSTALSNIKAITSSLTSSTTDMVKNLSALQTSIRSGNITGIVKSIDELSKAMGGSIKSIAGFFLRFMDSTISGLISTQTKILAMTTKGITGGLQGAVGTFGNSIQDVMNQAAKQTGIQSFSAVGGMVNQIIQTSMAAFSLYFQDRLSQQKMKYLAASQTGGGAAGAERGAVTVSTMRSLYGNFAREEAEQWANSMLRQGAVVEPGLTDMMIRVGKQMQIEPGEMGGILDKMMTIATKGQDPGKMMSDSFRASMGFADKLGVSTQKFQKNIMDATAQARFLNVDMKTVSSTMQMLTNNQEKFRAAGVSIREDGGKILGELTGGSKKFSDAMHVFFGTKGGTEGSPIEGLIKSKFGTTFASTLKSTAGGGFSAKEGTSGDMTVQRLDMMKSMMMDAAKGAKSDAERIYLQSKVAEETFGMSEETARVLAMSDKDNLKKLAENPKLADQFKSQKDIMSDLKSMAAIDQGIQRTMAMMAGDQIKQLIATATNTALMAAEALGVDVDKDLLADAAKASLKATMDSNVKMLQYSGSLVKSVVDSTGGKKKGEPSDTDNLLGAFAKVSEGLAGKLQTGGNVYPAQTGRNVYSVAEDGRPELFHSGSGSNTLFAPGEAGRIFNANETMNTFQKGLGGGGGGGGGAPTVNRSGGGEKTVLNITINAGTLDKGSFAKLLETEILNHIYR